MPKSARVVGVTFVLLGLAGLHGAFFNQRMIISELGRDWAASGAAIFFDSLMVVFGILFLRGSRLARSILEWLAVLIIAQRLRLAWTYRAAFAHSDPTIFERVAAYGSVIISIVMMAFLLILRKTKPRSQAAGDEPGLGA